MGCNGRYRLERGKAFGDEVSRLGITRLEVGTIENNNNDTLTLPRGRNRDGEPSLGEVAGLQAVAALDVAQQMIVGAHDYGFIAGIRTKGTLPSRGISQCLRMLQQLTAQNREIAR